MDIPREGCSAGTIGKKAPIRRTVLKTTRAIAAFLLASAMNHLFANVSVTNAFSSHAVLQRNMAIPIRGKASSGEQVSVTLGSQTKTVTTPSNGSWSVKLDPMTEAGPLTLTIKGNNTVTATDVYIGDVWQVAGQSNMDIRLSYFATLADTIKNANIPLMRYYTLRQPGQTTGGLNPWLVVSPSTAGDLSATGYFFGREIQKTTGVAVGLVVTAVGGTRWISLMGRQRPSTVRLARQVVVSKHKSAGRLSRGMCDPE